MTAVIQLFAAVVFSFGSVTFFKLFRLFIRHRNNYPGDTSLEVMLAFLVMLLICMFMVGFLFVRSVLY